MVDVTRPIWTPKFEGFLEGFLLPQTARNVGFVARCVLRALTFVDRAGGIFGRSLVSVASGRYISIGKQSEWVGWWELLHRSSSGP